MIMRKIIFYWGPLLVYMSLIFYFSSLPRMSFIEVLPDLIFKDKLLHIIEYFILGLLVYRVLSLYQELEPVKIYLTIIISTFYGLSDEIHQIFVLGRFFSFLDLLADFIGSLLIFAYEKTLKTLKLFNLKIGGD